MFNESPGRPRTPIARAQPRLATDLGRFDDQPALFSAAGAPVEYRQLDAIVDQERDYLGAARRLVLIEASNTLDTVVSYLAALGGGHTVLLTGPGTPARALVETYDPDVAFLRSGPRLERIELRRGTRHELHPDLALLLSTSGSTGSPKLVRLSHENLGSNADAIADYLSIDGSERAALAVPLHYCYGLSVLHSHLVKGASVVLGEESVVDPCFWHRFEATGATSLAGVPHTFELLDRVGFADMRLPNLRYLTQAGGRLAPDKVQRYAELGTQRGWRFYVMYGQTEATARMAYLPPELAASRPGAIGVAVPGGSFEIDAPEGTEGELIYRGPNVMLGYAHGPDDLALGRTVYALRTGDIARRTTDGLIEIVGRAHRFTKLFGLRIDLDRVEQLLDARGVTAVCGSDDRGLVVAVTGGSRVREVTRAVHEDVGLPERCVAVLEIDEIPRLPSGKPDTAEVVRRAGEAVPRVGDDDPTDPSAGPVRKLFSEVLACRPPSDDDTFVGLGGDSLSYVELSMLLEEELGPLPRDWHLIPVAELEVAHTRASRGPGTVTTDVVLRAVAIVLIVGTHAELFPLRGGAHVLLAVSGFNFVRFFLERAPGALMRPLAAAGRRIALPTMTCTALLFAVEGWFEPSRLLLFHNYAGRSHWRYWYIEVLLQMLTALTIVSAVPALRRFERTRPFAAAASLLVVGVMIRFAAVAGITADSTVRTHQLLWLFATGWAAARCTTAHQRALVSVAALACLPGFFGDPSRELVVAVGVMLLVWAPRFPVPRPLHKTVGALAATSLYVYLIHFEIYQRLLPYLPPVVVTPVAILAGVVVGRLVQRAANARVRTCRGG